MRCGILEDIILILGNIDSTLFSDKGRIISYPIYLLYAIQVINESHNQLLG